MPKTSQTRIQNNEYRIQDKTVSSLLYSKFRIPYSNKGFTLIELMVAISIVAILSTIGIVSFSKTQSVARDSKRKSDLRSIAIALELYYQKNGFYPKTNWVNSSPGGTWIPGLSSNYLSKQPQDPKQTPSCTVWNDANCFTYAYYADDWCGIGKQGYSYLLTTRMENSSDKDAGNTVKFMPCGNAWGTTDLYTLTN